MDNKNKVTILEGVWFGVMPMLNIGERYSFSFSMNRETGRIQLKAAVPKNRGITIASLEFVDIFEFFKNWRQVSFVATKVRDNFENIYNAVYTGDNFDSFTKNGRYRISIGDKKGATCVRYLDSNGAVKEIIYKSIEEFLKEWNRIEEYKDDYRDLF